jgi:E3 ubiquitin-protein ligase RNF115/126
MSEFLLSLNSGPNLLNFLRGRLFPPNASDDDILNLLFQQHQPQTPPPTSKRFIETCPTISITNPESHDLCLVCQDSYQIGDEALKLPCKHLYHKDCLIPWLQSRNTCPTCRFALPVDEDEDKSKCASNEANSEASRSESVSERNP